MTSATFWTTATHTIYPSFSSPTYQPTTLTHLQQISDIFLDSRRLTMSDYEDFEEGAFDGGLEDAGSDEDREDDFDAEPVAGGDEDEDEDDDEDEEAEVELGKF